MYHLIRTIGTQVNAPCPLLDKKNMILVIKELHCLVNHFCEISHMQEKEIGKKLNEYAEMI